MSEAIFDAVLRALNEQRQHPDRHGGGLIGQAAAVVGALGIDGDAPVSNLRVTPYRSAPPAAPSTEGPTTGADE